MFTGFVGAVFAAGSSAREEDLRVAVMEGVEVADEGIGAIGDAGEVRDGGDAGDGIDYVGVLLEEDGALGLEVAELGEGAVVRALKIAAVAGDAVELVGGLFVVNWVRFGEEGGFEGAGAAEVPAVGEEALEEFVLEGAFRAGVVAEVAAELVEGGLLIVGDDEGLGGEAVLAAVGGGAGRAFGGAGASGELGVGLVGGDLGWGSHGGRSFGWRNEKGRREGLPTEKIVVRGEKGISASC